MEVGKWFGCIKRYRQVGFEMWFRTWRETQDILGKGNQKRRSQSRKRKEEIRGILNIYHNIP